MGGPIDSQTQTTRTEVASPELVSLRDAILVHIYPTGPGLGRRYVIGLKPVVIGRSDGCDIAIHDNSISRRHAQVQLTPGGVSVTDLGSTNGTFLNGTLVASAVLNDGDYLRVGNCIYRFLAGGNVEAQYHEEIHRLTIIDGLTETHNKRYLLEFLDRELARAARYQRPLAMILLDIDHFKQINDRLGHLAGDYALRELAHCLKGRVRREELLARYGGEEFAIILPETSCAAAVRCAEGVRATAEGHPFEFDGERFTVTVSVGVVATPGHAAWTSQELILRADRALYRAKGEGRNRVCVWADDEPEETVSLRKLI
jgi:diguanylate cyclase (GGDEF)-like protein